jgi:hypothetical protein
MYLFTNSVLACINVKTDYHGTAEPPNNKFLTQRVFERFISTSPNYR